jgi:23S rRNA (guanine745-N1)-methyltransferase
MLACPHCGARLDETSAGAACGNGHAFDRARQGYLSLLQPGALVATGDDAEMVAARTRFLGAGHYDPLRALLAAKAGGSELPGGGVVDLGAGTGYYTAAVLDALPGRVGVALDTSKPALRTAARAHPRLGAVAADAWRPLPLRAAAAAYAQVVFAPRNPAELVRILAPDGLLVTVTPGPRHLEELVTAYGLLAVEDAKEERLAAGLDGGFEPSWRETLDLALTLDAAAVADLVAMTPSARHGRRAGQEAVTRAHFVVRGWRRRG